MATDVKTEVEPGDGEPEREHKSEANQMIGAGVGIGAFGAVSALVLGATCPICVVAAPALIGAGVLKRLRSKRVPDEDPAESVTSLHQRRKA
jgi:hypothetical protein